MLYSKINFSFYYIIIFNILLNFLKNLLKIFTNLPLFVLSLHRLRLENRSAAEATRTRIAIQVKYGTNDQKHRGCLADAEEQPHQQTVGHDDLRLFLKVLESNKSNID